MWEEVRTNRAISALLCFIVCLLLGLSAAKYLVPQNWAGWTMATASISWFLLGLLLYHSKQPVTTYTAVRGANWRAASYPVPHDELLKAALDLLVSILLTKQLIR
jgi:hypothetical protein